MEIRPILVTRIPEEISLSSDLRDIMEKIHDACHKEYIPLFTRGSEDKIAFELLSINDTTPADLEMIKQLVLSTEQLFKRKAPSPLDGSIINQNKSCDESETNFSDQDTC